MQKSFFSCSELCIVLEGNEWLHSAMLSYYVLSKKASLTIKIFLKSLRQNLQSTEPKRKYIAAFQMYIRRLIYNVRPFTAFPCWYIMIKCKKAYGSYLEWVQSDWLSDSPTAHQIIIYSSNYSSTHRHRKKLCRKYAL